MIRNSKRTISDYVLLIILIAVMLLCLMPIWNTLMISLSDKSAVAGGGIFFIPTGFNLIAYSTILKDGSFFRAAIVSIERVLLGGGITFVLTILMAYALSHDSREFRYRNVYMWTLVFTMLFSGGLIPFYLTIKNLKMLDSIWALVLPGAVPVFSVILLLNFFRNIPKELKEAAYVDGAGPWYIMVRIFVPISLPALATVTLFSIVTHWNSFLDGLLFMNNPDKYPLQTYIQQLVVQIQSDNMNSEQMKQLAKLSNKTLNAAKIFLTMIPILLVYPFLQRFFIHGITLGSVKE
ncbi:carbohydrate ABC transporter permease [Cohnella abietis]|uniref:Putative ABC transporter permease protein YtcP n=1 Tax=Cohnella abietis TaxID=2507935 RepID=A0A3T1D427_9BACL|nr:carbohydrate ABC transporter permease [Cohnella abietis]BBI32735.1 putative ABC transporter permease protein YtcP [Cohnella abietis]